MPAKKIDDADYEYPRKEVASDFYSDKLIHVCDSDHE